METDQLIVIAVLAGALVLFSVDYWRYDVVAVLALMVLAITGIVPADEAFSGFGHAAVVTVAAVLILSAALEASGVVDRITSHLTTVATRPLTIVAALCVTVAALSSVMNNVGALVLMLPVAVQVATRHGISTSLVLMPLGFASILGGLTTLIGTPPNIIVSTYRQEAMGSPYELFDFAPVGLLVVAAGVAVLVFFARMLVKDRGGTRVEDALEQISAYISEVTIPTESPFVGKTIRDIEELGGGSCSILALVRGDQRRFAPPRYRALMADDVLVIEADPETLQAVIDEPGIELTGERRLDAKQLISDDITLVEVVVKSGSLLERRTAAQLSLHSRFGVNLLAVSHQGRKLTTRLGRTRFKAGDVLLLQGDAEAIPDVLYRLGCLPIRERQFRGRRSSTLLPAIVFGLALVVSALGLLEVQIALVSAVLIIVLTRQLRVREAYERVDWSIIVLLGAMVPVGRSLETTGVTTLFAQWILETSLEAGPGLIVALLLVVSMAVSNVVNNAATAILMAPIALSLADSLGRGPDGFLMAVAIGSSCAFLTPIGHQSNLLVMGPGGYRFGDYWRLGLPLSVVSLMVAAVGILLVWPVD